MGFDVHSCRIDGRYVTEAATAPNLVAGQRALIFSFFVRIEYNFGSPLTCHKLYVLFFVRFHLLQPTRAHCREGND
jgi:hypothetical protein